MQILIKNEANYKHLLQIYENRQMHGKEQEETGEDKEKALIKQLVIKQPLLSKLVEENISLSLRNKNLLESYDKLELQLADSFEQRDKIKQFYLATLDFLN